MGRSKLKSGFMCQISKKFFKQHAGYLNAVPLGDRRNDGKINFSAVMQGEYDANRAASHSSVSNGVINPYRCNFPYGKPNFPIVIPCRNGALLLD